jgi:uncharacterized protein
VTAGDPRSSPAGETPRVLLWRLEGPAWDVTGLAGLDLCRAGLDADRLRARGTALVADPEPFRVDYEVETGAGFVTERVSVSVEADGGTRRIELRRGGSPELEGRMDVDLAGLPLFNTLPILRLGLLGREEGTAQDIEAAFVGLPELEVVPSRQRYTALGEGRVRYESLDSGFRADLEVDADGFVVAYPSLATRLRPSP